MGSSSVAKARQIGFDGRIQPRLILLPCEIHFSAPFTPR
jgi:hypothetical protein